MRLSVGDMESNLYVAWAQITPQDLYEGLAWYPAAHDLAFSIGHGDVRKGAGILAALSPNKAWETNKALAIDAGNGDFHGHVGNALLKAMAIYAGADPVTVLPMHRKTGHFYMNIYKPLDPSFVTIDRHMIRALKSLWDDGEPKITLKEYDDCVLACQKVAANVGLAAPSFQAALWGWARREFKA